MRACRCLEWYPANGNHGMNSEIPAAGCKVRTPVLVANWKMHKNRENSRCFVDDFLSQINEISNVEIVICPPYTSLDAVQYALRDSAVHLGAQNLFWAREGAYTGEISAGMLADAGCEYVLVGHSERRSLLGEDERQIYLKLQAAWKEDLIPILCVGETLEERQAGKAEETVRSQLKEVMAEVDAGNKQIIIAYEPVWAIGTGVNAEAEDARQMAAVIRSCIGELWGREKAETIPILYGGSVKTSNAKELAAQEGLDGALVGGASLNADEFARIVRYWAVE